MDLTIIYGYDKTHSKKTTEGGSLLTKIPKELTKYGRVTIYAGSDARKHKFIQLLKVGQGKSLSQLLEEAVTEFLQARGRLGKNSKPLKKG